jgi:carbon starvation protein CstA
MHLFPFLFITIACGAISGFHATQSPLMARCLKSEREGRRVFYGAMIVEGVVALIWAAAAMAHFGSQEGLAAAGPAAVVVNKVSQDLMGVVGGILAVLGVVACPITSGDTAFRSARLTIADSLHFNQRPIKNRFLIALPLFAIGIALCFIDFNIIWRYFAWSNQTLATIALWAASAYLAKTGKCYWIALIPATFMTVVVTSYIFIAPEGFKLPYLVGPTTGIIVAAVLFCMFIILIAVKQKNTLKE